MPRVSGVDAVREMRSKGIHVPVVFFGMVAEVKTFLEAFDLRAVSYFITASIDDSRLCRVLMDVKEIIEERRWEAVAFSCAGEIRNIPVRDIEYFEVHGRIITVHYDGKTFDFYSQLSNIEELMHGRGFVRTHRAYLVAGSRHRGDLGKEHPARARGENPPLEEIRPIGAWCHRRGHYELIVPTALAAEDDRQILRKELVPTGREVEKG
ncbi:MAG: LytTR family transcriptional regulator DNA-binding domain-containing protein [Atopobiaceae bacterium]|jgi:hypothetical protein|nr:LytTR family transcriptional regulator DNA-binding domain-containing protein [Atopobiaceae bacterium]